MIVTLIVLSIVVVLLALIFLRKPKEEPYQFSVTYAETVKIDALPELGELCHDEALDVLEGEIELPYWDQFTTSTASREEHIALLFHVDQGLLTVNKQQIATYRKLLTFEEPDWSLVLTKILWYYLEYYKEHEVNESHTIEGINDLKQHLALEQVVIDLDGSYELAFSCDWDDEHDVGVKVNNDGELILGDFTQAMY